MALYEKENVSIGQLRDEDELAALGIKQELKRNWSVLENFGVSFSIISVVTGITTLFSYGLTTGGPAVMSGGWFVVCFFTGFVALSMAEIVSSNPSAGGPYHWAALLASPQQSAFFAYLTGNFSFIGQVAISAGVTFGCAGLVANFVGAYSDFVPTAANTLGIYAGLIVSQGLINSFGVGSVLDFANRASIALNSLGIGALAIALLIKAPIKQSAAFVFTTFTDGTGGGVDGFGWSTRASPVYVAVTGILLAQYTITGYDASAHLAEETQDAARNAPKGILMAVGISSLFGFFYMCSLLFSIQDLDTVAGAPQPVLQILQDAFGENGAIVAFTLIILCVYTCGLFSITTNSRMMFAYSRDGGLPHWFDYVDRKGAPLRTIWLAVTLSFLLAIPSVGSTVAFAACTSIATIGLYLSYGIPVAIALFRPTFVKGPFDLGKWSKPCEAVATLWIGFISIAFCLPTADPVTIQTLNYTPVALGIVTVWTMGSWYFWAHTWFKGPLEHLNSLASADEASDKDDSKENVNAAISVASVHSLL